MKELPERIHDDTNGLDYVLVGDYYIPAPRLIEESRPIGHWGRRRKAYLEEARPALYCSLLLSGKLWTHLADVDEQAQERLDLIMEQMKAAEGVTEKLKADDQLEWVRRCNSIRSWAEEIIYAELVYVLKCYNFGLVEQNYELPDEVLHELGVETIPIPRTQIERIDIPRTQTSTADINKSEYETIDITVIRRGVIGVNKIGYVMT